MAARLPETYQWLLVPEQKTPTSAVEWQAVRLSGSDALAVRASRKLRSDESLVINLGSTILRKHLDSVPLWRGDHVAVRQLVEDFARYLYLPRLAEPGVLVQAICDGVALLTWRSDIFAYAESHDEVGGRYRGLRGGQTVTVSAESPALLVKPDIARRQNRRGSADSSGAGDPNGQTGWDRSNHSAVKAYTASSAVPRLRDSRPWRAAR